MSRETQCSENQICAEWRSVFLDFTDKNVCYIKLAAHCCMHVQYDYIFCINSTYFTQCGELEQGTSNNFL
jgi:hypothetical protein